MLSDIEIARSTQLRKISSVAQDLAISEEQLEHYGQYMAKVPSTIADESKFKPATIHHAICGCVRENYMGSTS